METQCFHELLVASRDLGVAESIQTLDIGSNLLILVLDGFPILCIPFDNKRGKWLTKRSHPGSVNDETLKCYPTNANLCKVNMLRLMSENQSAVIQIYQHTSSCLRQ